MEEVSELLANLRRDDVVCEGLREFGSRAFGLDWQPNQMVEASVRRSTAMEWEGLYRREPIASLSMVAHRLDPRLG